MLFGLGSQLLLFGSRHNWLGSYSCLIDLGPILLGGPAQKELLDLLTRILKILDWFPCGIGFGVAHPFYQILLDWPSILTSDRPSLKDLLYFVLGLPLLGTAADDDCFPLLPHSN